MGSILEEEKKSFLSNINGNQVIFTSFELPNSRIIHGNVFQIGLNISKVDGSQITLEESAAAVRDLSERGITTDLTNKHNCVILRGVNDSSPHAFSALVHAAEEGRGRHPYEQIGLAGSRTVYDNEVFSASESLQHLWFHQHNEYSRYTRFPSNIHFFCQKAPPSGGESPFTHSSELVESIMEEMPEFFEECRVKGLNSPDIYRPPGREGKNFIFTWAGPLAFGKDIQPSDDMATIKKKSRETSSASYAPLLVA
ncbi:Clavaminate synthase-like protein [Penicillium odoratum]|uniref:Clavaminate synthase-like protein n=1 Tax=Penicillium odoratum TaxID=1167516 RepID=UPI0025478D9C|nr:Clavaminate synthase-like protein [Penicillium odoratum]KAJ5759975.1 Clavaminate synthase-like protein [Penicillium odoratum]